MNSIRLTTIGFGALWLAFLIYSFGFAPSASADQTTLILNLSSGNWSGINPLIIALFNLMGIWPLIYACVLIADGREQKLWAWLFMVGSFAAGAFALLPYLALRRSAPQFQGPKDRLLRSLDSRWLAGSLAIATIGLMGFGLLKGDWSDFIEQWQTSQFIHVMSLDFCLLSLCFAGVVGDDLKRRGVKPSALTWVLVFVPMVGPLIYLCTRPPLPEPEQDQSQESLMASST